MKTTAHILLLCLFLICSCSQEKKADLIIRNTKIVTVDANFSFAEAVAVADGKIIWLGENSKAEKYIGDGTRVIDAEGLLVLPGLIDAHAHLVSLGDQLSNLEITSCNSLDEIILKLAERVALSEPGEWIIGGRWDHSLWEDNYFPIHDRLSEISPNNPVYLKRVDGNSAFVNQKAMDIAGINNDTPDPAGGKIHRKSNGEPSGVLINQAMNLVLKHIPKDSPDVLMSRLKLATQKCSEEGLTGVHEAGIGQSHISVFKTMADRGELPLRINAMLGDQEKPIFEVDNLSDYFRDSRIESYADDMLCLKTIKLFFDGALGSGGAAFHKPYFDDPENDGLLRIPPEYITEVTRAALENKMSVATHCIGIRGNSLCLDAYEEALIGYPGTDHRLRIEHAQVVRKTDIARFVDLSILPAMQPAHCTSDKGMIASRIGEDRTEFAYAWRSFIDAGLIIPAGSDFPVVDVSPLLGIYAAVTRKLPGEDINPGWHPEQCMTLEEAIKSFTIWAAYGSFQEDIIGSIEPGKYGDFTIIDRDITRLDYEEILSANIVYTIVAGEIKYSAITN
jgi:predicted amidohydrolase YtcJ